MERTRKAAGPYWQTQRLCKSPSHTNKNKWELWHVAAYWWWHGGYDAMLHCASREEVYSGKENPTLSLWAYLPSTYPPPPNTHAHGHQLIYPLQLSLEFLSLFQTSNQERTAMQGLVCLFQWYLAEDDDTVEQKKTKKQEVTVTPQVTVKSQTDPVQSLKTKNKKIVKGLFLESWCKLCNRNINFTTND